MHSMNAIYDEEYYEDTFHGFRLRQKRAMWVRERRYNNEETALGLSFKQGYYMFGGVD